MLYTRWQYNEQLQSGEKNEKLNQILKYTCLCYKIIHITKVQ